MNDLFLRSAILIKLLDRQEPVVVLSAPAGMGKSVILGQIAAELGVNVHIGDAPVAAGPGDVIIWDIPPYLEPAELPEIFVSGAARIFIAKRAEVVLPGLSRAIAYGKAYVADPKILLVSNEELIAAFGGLTEVQERIGGWPLVAFNAHLSGDALISFLVTDMLRPMPAAALVDMQLLLQGRGIRLSEQDSLLPFENGGCLNTPAIVDELDEALEMAINERLHVPAESKAIAEAFERRGCPVEAILMFQRAGFFDSALRVFNDEHGDFFLYFHGPAAFARVLDGFPRSFALQTETLVLSMALQALKTGDVSRARHLLSDRFGDLANDPEAVFSPRSVFSREFRAFRLLMLIYEDYFFSEELLQRCFALVAEFPLDEHLFRGSFYNSVLEFYIRNRRFAEAEDVAQRAMYHYECAKSPMLCFYISLHRALIRLLTGDVLAARKYTALSAKCLVDIPFESPSDARLQALLEACVDYETGRAEPLARFLSLEIDDFSHGEIWPSLLELALHYGSQALGDHFSTIAARSFLDRWRVYQVSNRQFQIMIEIREATILQNANRWQEAAERLSAIDSRIDRNWVLGSSDHTLAQIGNRDDIALALAWMRQVVYEQPGRKGLDDLIAGIMRNLSLTDRQRIGVEIWLAYIAKRQRNLTRARALLQKTFEDCARLGAIAPLSEERVMLDELIGNERIGAFLSTSLATKQIIRKLKDSGRLSTGSGKRNDLSRRESKILMMISEGAANKYVAHSLGLSEATVKFHLGNVYRKLGCRNRQEAIGSARALGIVK
ncbi:LuxR C-terminal-related transcriptional regulator [Rhizobium sp. VS19-DR104.2]|uniref:LuxR C-terminal-related transcriptional regulator n=1 Tax=unclassified Rhizobium TaxID=2613769 RepID=UPI001C5B8C99|nr:MULTISPECIES: LuxR C-terminal-related transcriptional regulator [unclassified Rhizobium]MBZ5762524.1 LuxR C-terminal-related transcriptional regulator [Rhizobium sp. VS19-DR96]MBZ5768461.1 LuxR C-terminal-related transcriptional regulator [Rhizobium sp. VS19-DR129.2]MBZ5775979.1 LuxR C-terminal-related transcriptional regulator [Rhizobium sp. VS19-DRK62.2]MBZ5787249.1 LuxR C-terminal-related transcriptional regulator [Rhizobium sp. VS19-DR121]MBZ5804602.1 LuxR C-terminal-related transcripti